MWIPGITSWASSTPSPNGPFCPMASSNGVFARVEYEKSALRSSSVMLAASHNGCRTLPMQKRRFPCPRHKIAPFGNGVLSRGRCGGRDTVPSVPLGYNLSAKAHSKGWAFRVCEGCGRCIGARAAWWEPRLALVTLRESCAPLRGNALRRDLGVLTLLPSGRGGRRDADAPEMAGVLRLHRQPYARSNSPCGRF